MDEKSLNAISNAFDIIWIGFQACTGRITSLSKSRVELVLLPYVASLLDTARAITFLYQEGHYIAADALIRRVFELSVDIMNVVEFGENYINRLMINSHTSQLSYINFVEKKFPAELGDLPFAETKEQLRKELKELHETSGLSCYNMKNKFSPKIMSFKDACTKAAIEESYVIYKKLCMRTHPNAQMIWSDNASELLPNGKIIIGKPFSLEELEASLSILVTAYWKAIKDTFAFYKMELPESELVEKLYDEMIDSLKQA